MKNKILISLISMMPFIACAEDISFSSISKGIQIIPLEKQALPASTKNQILNRINEEKVNGYVATTHSKRPYLLSIKQRATKEMAGSKNENSDPHDTHLKKSFTDINLSFPFRGVAGVDKKEVIGYAAIGSYQKDGWNGIKTFFSSSSLGNCAYSRMGILGAQLSEETTAYFVNKKPSNKIIEGNVNAGFVYSINWYTPDTMNTLECANLNFEPAIMNKMIVLANQIDKGM